MPGPGNRASGAANPFGQEINPPEIEEMAKGGLIAGTGLSTSPVVLAPGTLNQVPIYDPSELSGFRVGDVAFARQNYRLVQSKDDFPDPDAGKHILAANTVYEINGDVNTLNDNIVLSANTVLFSLSRTANKLHGTGTGTFITATDVTAQLDSLTLEYPNGTLFDLKNTAGNEKTETISVTRCDIDNVSIGGSIENPKGFIFRANRVLSMTSGGFTFIGSDCGSLVVLINIVDSFTGTLFDLGTSVWEVISFHSNQLATPTGTTQISGAAASANITSEGFGRITNTNFRGLGTFIDGITKGDVRWRFLDNGGDATTDDSILVGETIITATASTTVLNGTYSLIAGTTTIQEKERASQPSNMALQYDGIETVKRKISFNCAIQKDSGGNANYDFAIFKNDTIVAKTEAKRIELNNVDPRIVIFYGIIELATDDKVDARVSGNGTTDPVTAESGMLLIEI